jgi:hypothetical protein
MEKIRDYGFPVVLMFAWVAAAAYTLSLMITPPQRAPGPQKPPAAEVGERLAS